MTNAWPTETRLFNFTSAETTGGQNRSALVDAMRTFTGEQLNDEDFQS